MIRSEGPLDQRRFFDPDELVVEVHPRAIGHGADDVPGPAGPQVVLEDLVAVATASHELRTPATIIAGFAQTMQHRWHELDEPTRRDDRLVLVVEEAGAGADLVYADPHRTYQALHNLIQNAMECSPDEWCGAVGLVSVSCNVMDPSALIDAVTGMAWIALGVVVVRMAIANRVAARWLLVGAAFCALRALDFLIVGAAGVDDPFLVRALDVVVIVVLLGLVVGASRLGRDLEHGKRAARHAQAEYGRALLDYTQLVRHRIANPLTAVKGGIQTLLDIELDEAVRRQMLEAMLMSAVQLEQVALHPEQVGGEEAELKPAPAPLEGAEARHALEAEGGIVEADFRDVNRELIRVADTDDSRAITFVCECSARDCTSPIVMSLTDYYAVHEDPAQFAILPDHNLPSIEDVVWREPSWWIVRKRGKPARDARRRA